MSESTSASPTGQAGPGARRFGVAFFLLFALLVGAVGGFNRRIDPYNLFETRLSAAEVDWKPALDRHVRLWKAARLANGDIDAVLLGSSRTEYGLDPDHPVFRQRGLRPFNAGLPSATIYEVTRYFDHALLADPLKTVVIGIDFRMFDAAEAPESDFSETRLYRPGAFGSLGSFADRWVTTFSADTLDDSWTQLHHHALEDIDWPYYPNGQRHWTKQSQQVLAAGGWRRAFAIKSRIYLDELAGNALLPKAMAQGRDGREAPFTSYRRLLAESYRHGIDLRVFISPGHAAECEIYRKAGFWAAMDEWKRALVRLHAEAAAAAGKPAFPLVDFSCANAVTTEAVPPMSDATTPMQGYWEFSHFRKELGDRVLFRLYAEGGDDDFGIALTPDSIEPALATMRERQDAWRGRESALLVDLGLDGAPRETPPR